MAKAVERLTALQAKRASGPGLLGDGKGLYLRVGEGGAKSWVLRYMLDGRAREMGLGSYYDLNLAEARERARGFRRMVKDGVDPIDNRRAERDARRAERAKVMTFRQCADVYVAAHQAGWRNRKHAAQWPSTLSAYVYPHFGDLPVQTIDTGLVMKALEPIWLERPETAGRVRGRIESILDWATARGYRQGENPARWQGHLENLLPRKSKVRRVRHHPALPYAELGIFMADLRQQNGIAARALEFTILTAARTGEVIGARWDEINLTEKLWVVPSARMKAGQEHRVPLPPAALAILEAMRAIRTGNFIFSNTRGGQPISNMAMTMTLRRMGRSGLTVHGFRSSFRDWAAERTNFPREVAEMALAHTVSDKVEAAYRRGDLYSKRAQLMAAWARFCSASAVLSDIVPLSAPQIGQTGTAAAMVAPERPATCEVCHGDFAAGSA
jgi:integrase